MEDGAPSAPPLLMCPDKACQDKEEDELVYYAQRVRAIASRSQTTGVFCFTLAALVLCLVFYIFCPRCLFAILLVSACLCPFFNSMNAPLWLAIVLLTMSGWSFTAGAFSISWNAKSG